MPETIIELLIHFIATVIKLLKPGGMKVVMAETRAVKQQLIIMNRCPSQIFLHVDTIAFQAFPD